MSKKTPSISWRMRLGLGNTSLFFRVATLGRKLCLLIGLCLVVGTAFAVQVSDLYIAEIAIESQLTSERELATQQGLGRVVIRISGARDALANVWVKQALNEPDKFLKQFSFFTTKHLDANGNEIEQQRVRLNFDAALVDKLLRQAGLPIWGVNRPNLLLWIVQEERGNRSIIGADDDSALKQSVIQQALNRGLPTLFPLMDLQDKVTLSTTDAWGLFQERLKKASQRYNPEAILAAKVYLNDLGEWTGRWLFIFNGESRSFNVQTRNLAELPDDPINRVADYLANYYAINTGTLQAGSVKIVIKGVKSTEDYASVSSYMKKFAAVRDVSVTQVESDQLSLDLQTEGLLVKLKDAIALDNKLVPEASVLAADGSETLVFRWRP